MNKKKESLLLTKDQLAELLNVEKKSLPRIIYSKEFPAGISMTGTKHGSKRWKRISVLRWIDESERKAA